MWVKRVLACSQSEGSDRMVLVAVACAAGRQDGLARLPVEDYARHCRLTERQVQYCLKRLVKSGELAIHEKGGGRGKATVYRIALAWPEGTHYWPLIPAKKRRAKGCK